MKWKKLAILVCALSVAFSFAACGQVKENESTVTQQESSAQASERIDAEITSEAKEEESINEENTPAYQPESSAQTSENSDSEQTTDALLDAFLADSIGAVKSADATVTYYFSDLNTDAEGEDSYSVGERADLDNDGENELILYGPYGGIYLDGRDNGVDEFARGDGAASILSYTYYNGEIWIMYSSSLTVENQAYRMEKYEGANHLAAEMSFREEPSGEDGSACGTRYFLNEKEISCDEYTAFCSKIFAAEESTMPALP